MRSWKSASAILLLSAGALQAAPLANGDKLGIDLGPTTTANWNNFGSDSTLAAGSVVKLSGVTADGVSITTSNGGFYNNDGTDNWPGLSSNGGSAPADFTESVITDIAGNYTPPTDSPYTITVNGLDAGLTYTLFAVTTAPASGQIDTVTVTGASAYGPSPLLRSDSNAGAFHAFYNISPDANGTFTIGVTDTSASSNPIINAVLISVPEPASLSLLGLSGLSLLRRTRRV